MKALLVVIHRWIYDARVILESALKPQPFHRCPRRIKRSIHSDELYVFLSTGKNAKVTEYEYGFHDF